jgi:transposase-like protein
MKNSLRKTWLLHKFKLAQENYALYTLQLYKRELISENSVMWLVKKSKESKTILNKTILW